MATVNWNLGVGESLTNFLAPNTVAGTGGGSGMTLTGTGGRMLGLFGSGIYFTGSVGPTLAPGFGTFASSFSFQNASFATVVSVSGVSVNLYEFYTNNLVTSGAQGAIDYLFGNIGTGGNRYVGTSGAQVFEAFRYGDGFVGGEGDDVFRLGRVASANDISYIHGGNDGSDPDSADIDTIQFVNNIGYTTYTIHAVSNIDKLIFEDNRTTVIFYLQGTTSFLPTNLQIVQNGGVGSAIEVRAGAEEAVNWNFSGWTLTGGTNTVSMFTSSTSDDDDVIVGPGAGGLIYTAINTYGGDDSIKSGAAGDTIDAGDGDDTIDSGGYHDSIFGGAGKDLIDAGDGNDTVDGGTGDDTLFGGYGTDSFDGGDDVDLLTYERGDSAAGVAFSIGSAGAGTAVFGSNQTNFTNIEMFRGSFFGDWFSHASSGGAVYQGLAGADTIIGSLSGIDTLDYGSDYLFDHGAHNRGVVINATSGTIGAGQGPSDINLSMLGVILNPSSLASGEAQGTFGVTRIESVDYFDFDEFSSIEVFLGSALNDFMVGGEVAETLGGNAGDDWLYGEGGADSIVGGSGLDNLYGGASNDTLDGGAQNDTLDGGSGTDSLLGGTGNDFYIVNSTNDVIDETGGSGTDTVQSSVSFSLVASAKVIGTFENLTLTGSAKTGTGNDAANTLTGTSAKNTLSGGGANDTLLGGGGGDSLSGGSGTDTASYVGAALGVVINLADLTKNTNDAKGDVYSSIEKFIGSSHNDKFTGNASANTFSGGSGADTINGGSGNDTLTGGGSNDKFVFSTALKSTNVDTITDFSHDHDKIQLDDAIFKTLAGALTPGKFYAANGAKSAHDSNDRIIYDKLTGKLYSDDDGIGGHKAVHFATLTGHPPLDAGDFSIV